MSEFVIETQHLYKRFGQVTALENINIQIRQGEFIAIMGASGSGKTTLMNILTGLDTASEGNRFGVFACPAADVRPVRSRSVSSATFAALSTNPSGWSGFSDCRRHHDVLR